MSSYNVNIFASFPTTVLVDPQQPISKYGVLDFYLNSVPANQTCALSSHSNSHVITDIVITSNGINSSTFDLFPVKYTGEKVNFVAQLYDIYGFPVKDTNLLSLNDLSLSLSGINGTYVNNVSFSSNFGTLSSLSQGGFFKGYFVSPLTASNVSLKVVYNTGYNSITGYSSTFTIYPSSGIYDIRKINENFNQTDAYKSLATQPILYEKIQLLDNFIGQIVGNSNSDPNTLGIETFEKIANFVSNNEDIDYCNLNQLKSLLDSINTTYQDFNYQYPPSFRRLVDILSVKHKKLFGQLNQYQGNFNSKGYVNSPTYGLNKGNQLDFHTTELSAGSAVYPNYIIAYEKFGSIYTVANTNLTNLGSYRRVSTTNISAYSLSSYDATWGWGLVLPQNADITQYYEFYRFIPGIQGSLLQKFIDFDNPNNTLLITNSSFSEYTKQGGIIDNILLQNLYTGLEILS